MQETTSTKKHKAKLKRFYKKSVRKMKFAIARAVRAGKNEVMLDFQSIWELDATKKKVTNLKTE